MQTCLQVQSCKLRCLYCKAKDAFFIFCVCFFMHYLCEKCYKLTTVQGPSLVAQTVKNLPVVQKTQV